MVYIDQTDVYDITNASRFFTKAGLQRWLGKPPWKRTCFSSWNAKCPIFLGNFTPKTSNPCLKNRALGFPGCFFWLIFYGFYHGKVPFFLPQFGGKKFYFFSKHLQQIKAWQWRKHTSNLLMKLTMISWQFFVPFLGWLSDPFKGLSDLQLGDEKGTLNHQAFPI